MQLHLSIDADTRKYALLGERLSYTWLPAVYNSLLAATAENAIYLPLSLPREALGSAVQLMGAGFDGMNVAAPYQESVLPMADDLTAEAAACAAVGVLYMDKRGRLIGGNPMPEAFLRSMREHFIEAEDIHALVLGAGGAARAVAYALLSQGSRVTLAARHAERLRLAVAALNEHADGRCAGVSYEPDIEGVYDLIVNATPIGMYPGAPESPVERGVFDRCGAAFDAVYNPVETEFIRLASMAGLKAVGGYDMMFHQALASLKLWGVKWPQKKAILELRKGLMGRI